jgi:hypothetical protein
MGFTILISGNHFIPYAQDVVSRVEEGITQSAPEPQPVAESALV